VRSWGREDLRKTSQRGGGKKKKNHACSRSSHGEVPDGGGKSTEQKLGFDKKRGGEKKGGVTEDRIKKEQGATWKNASVKGEVKYDGGY